MDNTAWKVSVFGVFLVRIYLSVYGRNAGKYGPEKLGIRTLFTPCNASFLNEKLSHLFVMYKCNHFRMGEGCFDLNENNLAYILGC